MNLFEQRNKLSEDGTHDFRRKALNMSGLASLEVKYAWLIAAQNALYLRPKTHE
jgi:hypothetical protein